MKQYANIVFMQDESADEALNILSEDGPDAAIQHLAQWDFGGESEYDVYSFPQRGSSDDWHISGEYILSYNRRIGYIGLERIIEVEQ